jgi:hypothetical protein
VERQPVASTSIRSIGHDPDTGILEIEFQNDSIYQYEAVPEFLIRGLLASQSKGHFFRTRIQDRYTFRQVR